VGGAGGRGAAAPGKQRERDLADACAESEKDAREMREIGSLDAGACACARRLEGRGIKKERKMDRKGREGSERFAIARPVLARGGGRE
jgi:hypothetical protein